MKGMGNMMKQAQKMQQKMAKMQEELAQRTFEASAGGGIVKAFVTGSMEVKSIEIEQSVIEEGDKEMIEDLVVAAVNEAYKKAQDTTNEEMSKITGGLGGNLPGGLGGLF